MGRHFRFSSLSLAECWFLQGVRAIRVVNNLVARFGVVFVIFSFRYWEKKDLSSVGLLDVLNFSVEYFSWNLDISCIVNHRVSTFLKQLTARGHF